MNTYLDSPLHYVNGATTQVENALNVLNCRLFNHQDVEHIVTNPHFRFVKMPRNWFVRWFRFLFNMRQSYRIRDLPFLKLQDGTFNFTAKTSPVYLPSSAVTIPSRVDARVMHCVFYHSIISDEKAKGLLTKSVGLSTSQT